MFLDILERKNAFLGYKSKKLKKWKNCHFSKRVSQWFWSKIGHFSIFFKGNIFQKNAFYGILERKNVFLGYKKKKLKKSKNYEFSKGGSSWFLSKIGNFFYYFVLGKIGLENVFHDILKSKNACLGNKNMKFKSRKIDIFPKGLTHGFGPKMAIFSSFFFTQYRPGK